MLARGGGAHPPARPRAGPIGAQAGAQDTITDDGEVTVPSTEQFLRNHMAEFHTFIGRVLSVLPRQT
jgi:hypothetical protein